ncbi:MAG: hypothetical protein PWQ97_360 [Tepidanaerobacteraceae bacterium]|nr:hypothetical protein [Tepidanaerobacteraceae bacterium]
MDVLYYDDLWRPKKSGQNTSREFWDGRADHFCTNAYRKSAVERVGKLIAMLTEKGMLTKNSSVLDIGCGPGAYAVEIAKRAKEVVGIDISPRMLDHAENVRKNEKLENLKLLKLDWEQVLLEELKWEMRFDLVFASMCPAINSKNSLEKMIRASRGYCFMSTFARREESIRDRLAEELIPNWDLKSQGKGVYCCFNILWLMGYYPEITYVDSCWENKFSFREAVEYYCAALPIPGGPSKAQREFIESYLKTLDEDGLITEKVKMKFAWIYWKV